MSHTATAHIADDVFVWRTGCTCRWDDLHKRRLIIFFVDIAGCKTVCQMDGFVFRAKRKTHGKTDSFAGNGAFSVDTFTVFGFFFHDIVRNCLNIMNQSFIRRFESGFSNFGKDFVSDCPDGCVIISHMYISLNLIRNFFIYLSL